MATMKLSKKKPSENQFPRLQKYQQPLIEHLHELRKRLFYIAIGVTLFGALAYLVENQIIAALLWPAGAQSFIYTSPIDGMNFLFRVCLYVGIALSIPIIVYQFLRYLEPLFKNDSWRLIVWGSVASGVLALVGMAFGYFIGLPTTLHFLLHQFATKQISPLLTIEAYMSFVSMYMLGSALLLQVPLVLIFINRIKPLKPKKLLSLKYERWVILGAVVLGAIMNPDPNLIDQAVVVGPLIIMYQIGVAVVWFTNHARRPSKHVAELLQQDLERRQARSTQLKTVVPQTIQPAPQPARPISNLATSARPAALQNNRLRVINDFGVRPRSFVQPRFPQAADNP